jgi:hypothetical protein
MAGRAPYYAEGLHVGEVVGQNLSKAKTGTVQFVLGVKVLGVPNDADGYDPHKWQYTRTIYMALTDKTMSFVLEKLKYLGFDGTSLSQLDLAHPKAISFVGNQVDLWCKHDTNQSGDLVEKWNLSSGLPAMQFETLDAKEVRQLDALFGKALKANAPAVKSASRKAVQPEDENQETMAPAGFALDGTEITEDDLPFS